MDTSEAPSFNANNADLIVWSLYVLGGATKRIDVEDLYLKCFEIAPVRLGWRTRPDIPDYKKCAKALQEVEDPKRSNKVRLIIRLDQYHRQLSVEGVTWCEVHTQVLEELYGAYVPPANNHNHARKVKRVADSDAYSKFARNRQSITRGDLAIAFRCTETAPSEVWRSRLDELEVAAKTLQNTGLVEFLTFSRTIIAKV
jgi:hypothetical protein